MSQLHSVNATNHSNNGDNTNFLMAKSADFVAEISLGLIMVNFGTQLQTIFVTAKSQSQLCGIDLKKTLPENE